MIERDNTTHSTTTGKSIRIGHLYPENLNLYGDRGNILSLQYRCSLRNITAEVIHVHMNDTLNMQDFDMLFIGGGQDSDQSAIADDLIRKKGESIRALVEANIPLLAVCGGYQLLAKSYRTASGEELPGLGIFDAITIHKDNALPRCIGNIAIFWQKSTLVGFENHGGRTYLGEHTVPLGRVLKGYGNNGEDHTEGVQYKNAIGTYLHGSLLPKNPHLTDHLIALAIQNKYQETLKPIENDVLEWTAHNAVLESLRIPVK